MRGEHGAGSRAKVASIAQDCKGKGWRCDVFAVEVGCGGFVGKSTVNLLKRLGSDGRRLRSIIKELACTVERCSA